MQKRDFLQLTLPNDLTYLDIARGCVRGAAERFGFAGSDLYKIELAFEEAVSNVVKHAFEIDEAGTYDVVCQRTPLGMEIVIKEKGIPFDPGLLPQFDPKALQEEQLSAGMGVFLMKEMMDQVSFRNLGPEGKETRLVKYLPRKNIEEYFPPSQVETEPPGPAKPVVADKISYDVRLMQPSEAIEVSKCAYRSHGYTFFDDHIYYPERIVELNRTGQIVSAVAVTDRNEFMGHTAMVYEHPDDRIVELTFAFVNVEYRGQGCLNRLTEFLFQEAAKRNLAGVYGYAVTNHVFSQKAIHKYGVYDCGILLGTSPASWIFKGISEENPQRISMVVSFKYLRKPQPLVLYPPAHHREMIEKIYRNIEAEHRYTAPASAGPVFAPGESIIETEMLASEGNASMMVSCCGAEVVKEVRTILRDLCLKQVATVELLVPLADEATYFLVPEFEKMGFFFSGIMPETRIGDALILQYLNNVPLDYDKLQLSSDMAKEILEYIRKLDPNAAP